MQPESTKLPPAEAQLTTGVPVYPEAQLSPVQLATVTIPLHPLPLYWNPVVRGLGRLQVFSGTTVGDSHAKDEKEA